MYSLPTEHLSHAVSPLKPPSHDLLGRRQDKKDSLVQTEDSNKVTEEIMSNTPTKSKEPLLLQLYLGAKLHFVLCVDVCYYLKIEKSQNLFCQNLLFSIEKKCLSKYIMIL